MNGVPLDSSILDQLYAVIEERRGADPRTSYTAKLLEKGCQKITKKLGEEAVEVVIAALSETRERVAEESADVLYHLLVLWVALGIKPKDIWMALAAREGISGIAEKNARNKRG